MKRRKQLSAVQMILILCAILAVIMVIAVVFGTGINSAELAEADVQAEIYTEDTDAYEGLTAKEAYSFSLLLKSTSCSYKNALMEGCDAAAEKLGVTIQTQGPNNEVDTADQVNMLNSAVQGDYDGIGIDPSDSEACQTSLSNAAKKGVAMVAFETAFTKAPEGTVAATIAADHYDAGRTAGTEMWNAIRERVMQTNGISRVILICQDAVSDSHQQRGTGFIDGLVSAAAEDDVSAEVSGNDYFVDAAETGSPEEGLALLQIEVKVPTEPTAEMCQAEAAAALNEEDLAGIAATGQLSSEGILSANKNKAVLSADPMQGVVALGFDAGEAIKAAITDGTMYGAVVQSYYEIGYNTICALTAAANGEQAVSIRIPSYFYTADTMDDAEIAANLYD